MRAMWLTGLAAMWCVGVAWSAELPGKGQGRNRPGVGRPGTVRPGAARPGAGRPGFAGAGSGRLGGANPLAQVFAAADADKDGKVTLDELKAAMQRLPNAGPLSQNIDKLLQRLDANGDGALTMDELKAPWGGRPGNKPAGSGEPKKKGDGQGKNKPAKP